MTNFLFKVSLLLLLLGIHLTLVGEGTAVSSESYGVEGHTFSFRIDNFEIEEIVYLLGLT